MKELKVTARAKFFGSKVETRKCLVAQDGSVIVWDDVAGYYTSCHSLSTRTERRIASEARAQ